MHVLVCACVCMSARSCEVVRMSDGVVCRVFLCLCVRVCVFVRVCVCACMWPCICTCICLCVCVWRAICGRYTDQCIKYLLLIPTI